MRGWTVLTAAAAAPARRLDAALGAPAEAQQALLAEILARNAGSMFGRRHGFAGIDGINAYRKAVPVCGYEDLRADIDAMAGGAENLLVSDPVIAFERTGGTASGGKLAPYTEPALAGFRAAVLPWLHDLAARHPAATGGRVYAAISPATRVPERTPGGIPVGLESDAAYLGADLAPAFASLLAVSPKTGLIPDVETWRLKTLGQLLETADLSFVSVWSPTFLLDLIEVIPAHAAPLAAALSPPARRRLEAALSGSTADPVALWPKLAVISCWADGASSVFARRLAALCPQATIQPKGLLATEAAITLPFDDGPGAVPALTSTVLEFRDAAGDLHLAGGLREGDAYDVLLTTAGGLYRYDIGDRVRCVAKAGMRERLAFIGRSGVVSDMVGEKLDEAFVAQVLDTLPVDAVLIARTTPRPHYALRIDGPGDARLVASVEAGLQANPQYAHARRLGQLGPLALVSDPGARARETADRIAAGQRLGDIKPAVLRPAAT